MRYRYDKEENVIYKERRRNMNYPEILEFVDTNNDMVLKKLEDDFIRREHTINKLLNPKMPYYIYNTYD